MKQGNKPLLHERRKMSMDGALQKKQRLPVDIGCIRAGDKKEIARTLNLLENYNLANREDVIALISNLCGSAKAYRQVIGITGPPGVGKSSLISHIVSEYRSRNKTVGVMSVDPSSQRSGGALLGDRARIRHDSNDEGIFIRSMAAGSHLGGLARKTRHCLIVFEVVYDIIIVETVGVGQSETEIDEVADTIVFIVQPGSGDVIQYMKAGIMEIPHVLVVNKGDQKMLALKTRSDLETALTFSEAYLDGWKLKVVMTSAQDGWGQKELVEEIEAHGRFMKDNQLFEKRRHEKRILWIYMMFKEQFGLFGIEMMGGEMEVRKCIAQHGISKPFDTVRVLANQLHERLLRNTNLTRK
jgi:LAO/AO transport system kinase